MLPPKVNKFSGPNKMIKPKKATTKAKIFVLLITSSFKIRADNPNVNNGIGDINSPASPESMWTSADEIKKNGSAKPKKPRSI